MEEFKPRDYIEMETETNMDRADGLADELEGLTAAVKQCKDLDFLLPQFEKALRSEERRVGKECRSRWSPYH